LVFLSCSVFAQDESALGQAESIPPATTRIATSLNSSLCFGHVPGPTGVHQVLLVMCNTDAAMWAWPPQNSLQGPLRVGGEIDACLTDAFSLKPCQGEQIWTWEQNTSQIYVGQDFATGRCLTVNAASQFELDDCVGPNGAGKPGQSWIVSVLPSAAPLLDCRSVDCVKTWSTAEFEMGEAVIEQLPIYQKAGLALFLAFVIVSLLFCLKSCCAKSRPAPLPPTPEKEARSMFDCSGPARQPRSCFCCTRSPPAPSASPAYTGLLSNVNEKS